MLSEVYLTEWRERRTHTMVSARENGSFRLFLSLLCRQSGGKDTKRMMHAKRRGTVGMMKTRNKMMEEEREEGKATRFCPSLPSFLVLRSFSLPTTDWFSLPLSFHTFHLCLSSPLIYNKNWKGEVRLLSPTLICPLKKKTDTVAYERRMMRALHFLSESERKNKRKEMKHDKLSFPKTHPSHTLSHITDNIRDGVAYVFACSAVYDGRQIVWLSTRSFFEEF